MVDETVAPPVVAPKRSDADRITDLENAVRALGELLLVGGNASTSQRYLDWHFRDKLSAEKKDALLTDPHAEPPVPAVPAPAQVAAPIGDVGTTSVPPPSGP